MESKDREIVIYVGTRNLVVLEGVAGEGESKVWRAAGKRDADGFEHGLVTNLEKASSSILSLVNTIAPERPADFSVTVVLGNAKLKTFCFSSSLYFQGMPRTISSYEIRSVVNQTRSVATLPLSEFVLQAIPESFLVNDMADVRNPLGLETHRLGVNLRIYTMHFQDFKNISRALESADIDVRGYFPKPLTLSEAVVTDQEKEEGAIVVDVSDDHVQLILWKNGFLADTRILEKGGRFLTEQIASTWGIELGDAEKVKKQYATFDFSNHFGEEIIPLIERNGKSNHSIRRQNFQDMFLKLMNEWMTGLLGEVDAFKQEHRLLYPHLIICGGVTSMDGFLEYLQKEFSREARIGLARKVEAPNELVLNPSLAPALGMFRWMATHERDQRQLTAPAGILQKTLASARDWFSTYF